MKEIKNITDLRKLLCKSIIETRNGDIENNTMSEISNASGKIMQTAKLEMEYSRLRKESPVVAFMGE